MSSRYRDKFFGTPKTQSEVKLRAYEGFLKPWSEKVLSRNRRAWVVDGFSGPGQYASGRRGSPLIAMEQSRDLAARGKHLQCIFGDSRQANLEAVLSLATRFPQAGVIPLQGDFWSRIGDVHSLVGKDPALVFVDPFGLLGVRFEALAKLVGGLVRLDLIVNFRSPAAARLATAHADQVTAAVGSEDWDAHSVTSTFVRNLQSAGRFLPPAVLGIKERFGGALKSELIVAARHPDAYELWNDRIVLEAEQLSADAGEEPLDRLAEVDEVCARLVGWAEGRSRWRRAQAVEWHATIHCGDAHTGAIKRAVGSLLSQDVWRREGQSRGIDDDWIGWGPRRLIPTATP